VNGSRRLLWLVILVLVFCLLSGAFVSLADDQSFRILSIQQDECTLLDQPIYLTKIMWNAAANKTNRVQCADYASGPWQPLVEFPASRGPMLFFDRSLTPMTQKFYRVTAPYSTQVLTLVLDRSGSLYGIGTGLVNAVSAFIGHYVENSDQAGLASFATAAKVDVPTWWIFKNAITNTVKTLIFSGWTCSDQGLEKARQQNDGVTTVPGGSITKVIVFFTDGSPTAFQYTFNCGVRNIASDRSLWDPTTGAPSSDGCTVPATIPSVDGTSIVATADSAQMLAEAQKRAEAIANQARETGNTIYSIGLGIGVDEDFLKKVANDLSSGSYNPNQPAGLSMIAINFDDLPGVFDSVARAILQLP